MIVLNLYAKHEPILVHRIALAQAIERIQEEIETIAIKIAHEQATDSDIERQDNLVNVHLRNATYAFRLHLEGSGSNVRAYNSVHDRTIQTLAIDFLRTIQMVAIECEKANAKK
jgi:hypothetical protein